MCIMENVYWETIKLFEIEIELISNVCENKKIRGMKATYLRLLGRSKKIWFECVKRLKVEKCGLIHETEIH